ncbi:MAG: UTP--glucose-1-phosphate uridylyltransferase [Bryobacterales bacterium]|nr:UTP--glucose-1-phosphate uridylyltransferase [Bryobacterales bacterium]
MKIRKCVVTVAGPRQRRLPLQTLVSGGGAPRSVLALLLDEACRAGAEEVCLVVSPGDREPYSQVLDDHRGRVHFREQNEPLGYGHAVFQAREFVGGDPFLHMVGDHLYVNRRAGGCASALVSVAEREECAVSAVQPTREGLLGRFGAVGGQPVAGKAGIYRIDTVLEKPTPTEAEQKIVVPGLRAGHYLCFFGMHVLTAGVMEILGDLLRHHPRSSASLSAALAGLAERERYLACELPGRRFDLGARYGLFIAQFALAMSGKDREEVLSQLFEVLALDESGAAAEAEARR